MFHSISIIQADHDHATNNKVNRQLLLMSMSGGFPAARQAWLSVHRRRWTTMRTSATASPTYSNSRRSPSLIIPRRLTLGAGPLAGDPLAPLSRI